MDNASWPDFAKHTLLPLLEQNDGPAAVAALERYLVSYPRHYEATVALADIYRAVGGEEKLARAQRCYLAAMLAYRGDMRICTTLFDIALSRGDCVMAARAICYALYYDNRDPALWERYQKVRDYIHASWPAEDAQIVFYTGALGQKEMPLPSDLGRCAMGGSEASLLLMAKELGSRGLRVAIFAPYQNISIDAGVACIPIEHFSPWENDRSLSVCIVSRYYQAWNNRLRAKRRIYWLHDIVAPSWRDRYVAMAQQVDEYWLQSKYQAENYIHDVLVDPKKIWMTTVSIDRRQLQAPLPLEERPLQIMYASRPSRGLDIALEVCARLREHYSELTLLVCTYTHTADIWQEPFCVRSG